MSETDEKTPRRLRGLRVLAAGVAVVVVIGAASRWLPSDSFVAEIERIGGRSRQQIIDARMTAFLKLIHRQPLTVYHWIDLERSQADDAWLLAHREDIQRQSDLCLFVRNPRITTDGIAELRGLENIDVLDVTGMPLENSAVETFVSLPRLIQLYIAHTGISDTALAGLATSPHLVFLSIDRTQATEAGIDGLKTCPVLSGLWILDADDDCVAHVATFSRLTSLALQGDQFTIESLAGLKSLQHLKVLSLFDSKFTDAELSQLRQALPGCTIQQMESKKIEEIREASWE
jgi:hypothetical protein